MERWSEDIGEISGDTEEDGNRGLLEGDWTKKGLEIRNREKGRSR
jgi:hypothetical protein